MKNKILFLAILALTLKAAAQEPNVLFIGNSYTEVNNLPQMVYNMARSMGDNMTFSSNTPGGCTFMQHCSNNSMQMIRQGGWDIVILQEQSQYPSFPQSQVENEVFPYAERLIDSIYAHNPCAEPMFYMTWGRKNGDDRNAQFFPILGTYEGMDSMLCERYTYMADTFDASLCPVGRVWRYLRTNHPEIELYQSDNSHPSMNGSYAAACAFYTMIFHRDPDSIGYNPGINDEAARTIRNAAHTVVFEQLQQWQRPMPSINIDTILIDSNTVWLTYESTEADSLIFSFGDGTDTTITAEENQSLQHTYAILEHYTITVTAIRHCLTNINYIDIALDSSANAAINRILNVDETKVYPNPFTEQLTIESPNEAVATISSIDGRTICHKKITNGKAEIPFDGMPQGVYIIQITTHQGSCLHRVIKR